MIARLTAWRRRRRQRLETLALESLKARYHAFQIFLENNGHCLELIGSLDAVLSGGPKTEVVHLVGQMRAVTTELVDGLDRIAGDCQAHLFALHQQLFRDIEVLLERWSGPQAHMAPIVSLDEVSPSHRDQVGTKAAALAQLRRLGLPVPDGFVVTTDTVRRFLDATGLGGAIRKRLTELSAAAETVADCSEIRQAIVHAQLPAELSTAIDAAWHRFAASAPLAVSARSSAVAEDRPGQSFAGQFESVLNITSAEDLKVAVRRVVASAFSQHALAYRRRAGLALDQFDMAVLCQRLVPARCAGVLLTCDPAAVDSERMLVSAVPGLGTLAVGGAAPADLYRPARSGEDLNWNEASIAAKELSEVPAAAGGLVQIAVSADQRFDPLLTPVELADLVQQARRIESLESTPQDIEWAIDHQGDLYILQARPLRLTAAFSRQSLPADVGVLLATGFCASQGKAVGRVTFSAEHTRRGKAEGDHHVPHILLLPQARVEVAQHLCDFAGVIVDMGNPADHLSCVAREHAIPMVTGALTAAGVLHEGQWVVLDADRGRVYEASRALWDVAAEKGAVKPAVKVACEPRRTVDPVRDQLRRLIVPLNLSDAYGPTFSALECRSLHDLVRLAHEKAVLAMFGMGDSIVAEAAGLLHKVDIGVPFQFLVIDMGGGLSPGEHAGALGLADIRSVPLAALCRGLTTPGLSWHAPPQEAAVAALFSRAMLDAGSARPVGGFNYALVARNYLNLNARMEFHFTMLDALVGRHGSNNAIRFRFKGGGTGLERSCRRARFIREVLTAQGFTCSLAGDLVSAELVGAPQNLIEQRLENLGRLLGFSRFLDAAMNDEAAPQRFAEAFLSGRYDARLEPDRFSGVKKAPLGKL